MRHEAGDYAVEGQPVIVALAHQFADVRDMAGSQIGAQFDDDIAGFEGEGKCV